MSRLDSQLRVVGDTFAAARHKEKSEGGHLLARIRAVTCRLWRISSM